MAVADLGQGIPRTVNQYRYNRGQKPYSQVEAVEWALKLNMSTRSMPYNAGKGLDTVASFMKVNNGTWKLYSDEVRMLGSQGRMDFSKNPIENFIGTVIEITILVDNLEELETLELFKW